MKERVEELIRKTDHIGRKYNTPSTENGRESTVEGMLGALEVMLDAYPSDREPSDKESVQKLRTNVDNATQSLGIETPSPQFMDELTKHMTKVTERPAPKGTAFPMDLTISNEAYRLARRH